MHLKEKIARKIHSDATLFIVYAILASFLTYSCMYAFRKPFTAGTFSDVHYAGIHIKIWLITAQVLGYTLSKFIGIRVVSEMKVSERAKAIIGLVVFSEIALLLFAIIPGPYRIIFMFFNGLPLGLIWGIVFAYLEGRRFTELLGAGMSVSFILSSGFVKSVGKWLIINFGISDYWMPFTTGLIFMFPLIISVWLTDKLPAPSVIDESLRTHRQPMDQKERYEFFSRFALVIVILIVVYALLTIFREMRDNFATEIWEALGKGKDASVFTLSEIPVGIGVLICMSNISFIKRNDKALNVILIIIISGFALIGLSSLLYQLQIISGSLWMVLIGLGLYLGYVPFNALLFERMIARFKYVGNIGFVIYLADSFGYLSSVGVFFTHNFLLPELKWAQFFMRASYYLAFGGIFFTTVTIYLFRFKYKSSLKRAIKSLFNSIKNYERIHT